MLHYVHQLITNSVSLRFGAEQEAYGLVLELLEQLPAGMMLN